jgi:hypothetical protein
VTEGPWTFIADGSAGEWVLRGRDSLPDLEEEPPPPPPSNLNPELPFELEPLRAAMTASPRRADAHYVTSCPISVDNAANPAADYWVQRWLPPGGVEGSTDHRPYGGFTRNRPLTRPQRSESNWQQIDKRVEIEQAVKAGIDGFTCNLFQIGSTRLEWQRFEQMLAAANLAGTPGFLTLMPDGNTSGTADASALADQFMAIRTHPALYRIGGLLRVFPWAPERAPSGAGVGGAAAANFWDVFHDSMAGRGETPVMDWCFAVNGAWTATAQAPTFNSTVPTRANSRWGDRDPASSSSSSTSNAGAPAYNRSTYPLTKWIHPISLGDERPKSARYWEAGGWDNLLATWMVAINGNADGVQYATWNDYTEGSEFAPSRNNGWAALDVSTYFLARWKLGYYPPIVRDALYISHRVHLSSLNTFTGGQTSRQVLQGATAARDEVDVLAFLTAPATIQITSGGVASAPISAPAGFSQWKAPLRLGASPTAEAIRGGVAVQTVTTGVPVSNTQVSQDFAHRRASSRRTNTGALT